MQSHIRLHIGEIGGKKIFEKTNNFSNMSFVF